MEYDCAEGATHRVGPNIYLLPKRISFKKITHDKAANDDDISLMLTAAQAKRVWAGRAPPKRYWMLEVGGRKSEKHNGKNPLLYGFLTPWRQIKGAVPFDFSDSPLKNRLFSER